MKNLVIETILKMASQSEYCRVGYAELLGKFDTDITVISSIVAELFTEGSIGLDVVGSHKYITSTNVLYKEYPDLRPIPKSDFLATFKIIAKCCHANKKYHNVSYSKVNHMAVSSGIMTFDRISDELVKCKYIECKTISCNYDTFTITNKGIKAYYNATGDDLSFPKITRGSSSYVKKELTKEEADRQGLLRELAGYCSTYTRLKKKLQRGVVLSQEECKTFIDLRITMNRMREALGFETIGYAEQDRELNPLLNVVS